LSVFLVIPKANRLFESVHAQDVQTELALEAALFTRFIESQRTIIQDLAAYPSLTSAVMLSEASDRSLHELFDNVVIGGKKSRLLLQDIAGNILLQTDNKLRGNYANKPAWLEQILTRSIAYHLQLLHQEGLTLVFKMSVPVIYNNHVEGVLSSEIAVSLDDVFVTQSYNKVAFKLVQDGVTINTDTEHIEIHRENSLTLTNSNIIFTYITDDSLIDDGKRSLQNTILSVLLVSFAISFLLFAALGYRGLRSKYSLKVKSTVWKAYSIPMLVGFVGVSASVTAYMIASNLKVSSIEKSLIFESKQKIKAIRRNITANLQVLDSVKAFYNASSHINRQEFTTFITPLLFNHRNIQAIEWIPYISHQERSLYKKKAEMDGLQDFSIKEKNTSGELILAKKREHYFPVYYVEPMLGNEKVLGFDLASNNKRLIALDKAKLSGEKAATAKITLIQESKTQNGILVFNPIYNNNLVINGTGKQPVLQGFVLLVLKAGDLIADTSIGEKGSLLLYVEDVTDANNIETIYGAQSLNSTFSHEEVISVAGRTWRILIHNNIKENPLILSAWLILICGTIVSGLIAGGIAHLIRRREVVEQLVHSRTAELKASEEQYRTVVENAVDGLLTIDEIGTIETFNNAAQRIFGYSVAEVIGENIKILMPDPYHSEHDGYLKNYRDTGVKKIIGIGRYVEGKRKDGSIFPIDLSISEMKFGNTKKFSGIVRDVSERVALEKERERFIGKLTDSNEELARFAFVCSHDLQEPLRMVRSFSEKLQEHLVEGLKGDVKGQRYFHFVIDGAERAQTLITDILAYSSISSDTKILEEVNLEEIIKVIKKNMLDCIDGKKGEITFDALPILQGNKTQLFQLFQNLINNGLKYQKPEVTPHVHVGVEETETHWIFAIRDNGIGMEERHLKKIFDVFQRLHRRSQFAGTGVGLSICKKVAERHDGIIWVESEKGIGSTFYVKLLKPIMIEEIS
jgi:PAS domain S-box-containing protein